MRIKFSLALISLALVLPTADSDAQCLIGVFHDAAGQESVYWPFLNVPFDFYVVIRDEAAIEGVAYRLEFPAGMFVIAAQFSPDGDGFLFQTPNGDIIGFGECILGFGGQPILVAHYTALFVDPGSIPGAIRLLPNVDENPLSIVYATCGEQVVACENVIDLYIDFGGAVQSRSFGAVKSLY
ncbi:MAG TPA: hypothetical protein VGB13_00800 [Candidatus Krumholzibacteria bacterium]|jgi:hypothetical protein